MQNIYLMYKNMLHIYTLIKNYQKEILRNTVQLFKKAKKKQNNNNNNKKKQYSEN